MKTRLLIALAAALVLLLLNVAVLGKQRIVQDGQRVLIALAPIDPRSLMQGDYMALRFALAGDIERTIGRSGTPDYSGPVEGRFGSVPLRIDPQGIAQLASRGDEVATQLRYRIRDGRVWLGTNAFFFEEGQVERYRDARFGDFRVDRDSGEAVLVGLVDAQLEPM